MSGPSLPELETERERLYAQFSEVGDFRRGSVTENYRKCGKPNCACAQPDHPGHGPRFLWTRTVRGQKTKGRQLAAAEVAKVRRELERYAEFASLSEQIVEVSEKICEARPVAGTDAPSVPAGGKGGPRLLRAPRPPHALQVVPLPRPVRRLRGRGIRMQSGHRPAPHIVRHAPDRRRCQRHHHSPLPARQPPRRPDLSRSTQPDASRLTSRTR